jgi:hypothetical protein
MCLGHILGSAAQEMQAARRKFGTAEFTRSLQMPRASPDGVRPA